MSGGTFGRAVVVGAGISGLLAARVLSEHASGVIVLDRDALPEGPHDRRGVPQGRHLHSLATRGSQLLEGFFPGLDADLARKGAPLVDQALDTVTAFPEGRLPRFRSGITMRAVSRSLLEREVRRRVEALPNVRFSERREAAGLLHSKGRVFGVLTRDRDGSGRGVPEEIEADLVVDASGNASRAPRWLSDLGYAAPEEEVVDARLGYATRWYRAPEPEGRDWKSLAVLPGWPENPRGGSLRIVEGGLMTAVLLGIGSVQPPSGPEAGDQFEAYAELLPSDALAAALRGAEPVSPVYGYRRTANRRRRYERARMPEGFVVTGDAACVLNPSYGQGMTLAALSAEALARSLAKGRSGFERRFQRAQARAVSPAWRTTTASDAQWARGSLEELGALGRYAHRVSGEVIRTATADRRAARDLLAVKNLLASPLRLARPALIFPAALRATKPRLPA
ncbi:FAD binding domain [Rubrobacter radiotolerans]|uniref:FAD binding domain n=1 Tax=Rubrobacter radiotolerans TaxID=42256 RepID=A0A023WYY2_RUBRA|nr:FAD-dependent monooxygenase [Rubrobacter radiotolerans]AHY45432.1 FAD binding domain [Rubrobacter radiotolerans]MDX5892843.1 FAD-dependent monooxygenase [Rubrobacter radiotolerans]SMC02605.1 Dehydrogenase (flavoprotein) [Rubrobacter radiotolerans DSM 5868]